MTRASRTIIQPVGVYQVVSGTSEPARYRRWADTNVWAGPSRKNPAERSSRRPNTLGESARGRHIPSTLPSGATRAVRSQSDRNA